MTWLIRILALLTLTFGVASAQQPTFHDPLLDHLAGHWTLTGTIAHKPTTHDVTAAWTLNHQYLRIDEVSREKLPSGDPQYAATVFIAWNDKLSQYACVWLDVYGGATPLSIGNAPRTGNSIAFLFRDPDSTFHNTFTYIAASDTWTWSMDNDEQGKLIPFARVTLTHTK